MFTLSVKRAKSGFGLDLPTRATDGSAGYDLRAAASVDSIQTGDFVWIPTGFIWEIPEGYVGVVLPRSGYSTKQGGILKNVAGIIDHDFRGEVLVALKNDNPQPLRVERGDRIAQLVVLPFLGVPIVERSVLSDTERGSNGYGSSGMK